MSDVPDESIRNVPCLTLTYCKLLARFIRLYGGEFRSIIMPMFVWVVLGPLERVQLCSSQ